MYQEKRETESRNFMSTNFDTLSTIEMLRIMNNEDKKVAYAVEQELQHIANAVDAVYERLRKGGRLFYCGAGTSGRIGVLDASECPPTFSVPYDLVQGVIAGGYQAIFKAVEGAEDDLNGCQKDLEERFFSASDVLVGLAASGTTPYVLGGLCYAKSIGAFTVGVSCNGNSPVSSQADIAITPIVGPEVITGSTRLKAGTAEKMVLNMLSTGVMVRLGKIYGNLMVDLQVSNKKLSDRAVRIITEVAEVGYEDARGALESSDGEVKTAIVSLLRQCTAEQARWHLLQSDGSISKALR